MEATSLESVITHRQAAGGKRGTFVGGLILCILAGVSLWLGLGRGGNVVDGDSFPLVVDGRDLDFGEALMAEDFHWQLPIRNISSRPVEIVEFKSDCGCTSIKPHSLVIPPGRTSKVDLVLDTSGKWKHGEVDRSHGFSVVVLAMLGGNELSHARWQVKGRVRRPLAFSPPAVLYGETLIHGEHLPEKKVLVRAKEGVEQLAVDCDWPCVRVASRHRDAQSNGWFELTVSPGDQPLPLGRFEIDVRVAGVQAENERLPGVLLRLAGLVVPEIYAVPDTIRLRSDPLGDPVAADVVLQSRVDGEFEVEQVLTSETDLVIEPQHTGRGKMHAFRVECRRRKGPVDTTVSFVIRCASGDRKHVDVSVVEIH